MVHNVAIVGKDKLTYTGAPECYRMDERIQRLNIPVESSVDVWSLGTIFCEAVVWVGLGEEGLSRFREMRCVQTKEAGIEDDDCYHNGVERLEAVDTMLDEIKECLRENDPITRSVIELINFILVGKHRMDAKQLYEHCQRTIKKGRDKLQDYRNNTEKAKSAGIAAPVPTAWSPPPKSTPSPYSDAPHTAVQSILGETMYGTPTSRRSRSPDHSHERDFQHSTGPELHMSPFMSFMADPTMHPNLSGPALASNYSHDPFMGNNPRMPANEPRVRSHLSTMSVPSATPTTSSMDQQIPARYSPLSQQTQQSSISGFVPPGPLSKTQAQFGPDNNATDRTASPEYAALLQKKLVGSNPATRFSMDENWKPLPQRPEEPLLYLHHHGKAEKTFHRPQPAHTPDPQSHPQNVEQSARPGPIPLSPQGDQAWNNAEVTQTGPSSDSHIPTESTLPSSTYPPAQLPQHKPVELVTRTQHSLSEPTVRPNVSTSGGSRRQRKWQKLRRYQASELLKWFEDVQRSKSLIGMLPTPLGGPKSPPTKPEDSQVILDLDGRDMVSRS